MANLTTSINLEDMRKLERRAARIGMTPEDALKVIAIKGVQFFLQMLVGATKSAK